MTDSGPYAAALRAVSRDSGKPFVATFQGTGGAQAGLLEVGPDGETLPGSVPSYTTPEQGVLALARATIDGGKAKQTLARLVAASNGRDL